MRVHCIRGAHRPIADVPDVRDASAKPSGTKAYGRPLFSSKGRLSWFTKAEYLALLTSQERSSRLIPSAASDKNRMDDECQVNRFKAPSFQTPQVGQSLRSRFICCQFWGGQGFSGLGPHLFRDRQGRQDVSLPRAVLQRRRRAQALSHGRIDQRENERILVVDDESALRMLIGCGAGGQRRSSLFSGRLRRPSAVHAEQGGWRAIIAWSKVFRKMTMRIQIRAIVLLTALALGTAASAHADKLRSPAWDRAHLGADGLAKCQAYRHVRETTAWLQKADGGTITARERQRLQAQLAAAKRMPPHALTPLQCGVPL